eukprot:351872-Chlamydomonas_euryale.AAC.2
MSRKASSGPACNIPSTLCLQLIVEPQCATCPSHCWLWASQLPVGQHRGRAVVQFRHVAAVGELDAARAAQQHACVHGGAKCHRLRGTWGTPHG